VATFCLALANAGHHTTSQLMVAATALARAHALVRSTVVARSVSITDLRWCSLVSYASIATHLLASLPCCCAALRSASTCRASACTCCYFGRILMPSYGAAFHSMTVKIVRSAEVLSDDGVVAMGIVRVTMLHP
jgi:hypothetical protein